MEGLRGPISNTWRQQSRCWPLRKKKDTVCLHWPVENTDRYVFAGMGYVFTQSWQIDSPRAHRCYSRKLCKCDVTEKNLAHKPFQHSSPAQYMLLCSFSSHFFPIFFRFFFSTSLFALCPSVFMDFYACMSLSLTVYNVGQTKKPWRRLLDARSSYLCFTFWLYPFLTPTETV